MHLFLFILIMNLFGNKELFDSLQDHLKLEEFSKGDIIESSGSVSKKIYFINNGLIRIFYRSGGQEICCHFAKEREILTGIDSFFTGYPTIYTSQAIEDTQCYSLTKNELEWAFDYIEGMDRFGRIFITTAYSDLVERYNSMVSMTAQERYQVFMDKNSNLLNRIPLGYIASYLGMKQETLSRIRAKAINFSS